MSKLTTRIQLKHDIEANWNQVADSFVPLAGEACITTDGENKGKVKYGDGSSTWGQLPYSGGSDAIEIDASKVTFSKELPNDSKALVEYYSDGSFDADFSNITKKNNVPAASLEQRVIDMLARATVISWADKEKNFLLDIRNLLNDTDFKLHSPANSTKSKVEWVADLRNEIFNLQNKLDWDMRNRARSRYGY